jgi:8-amino-7-oxononanoate synthase
MGIWDAYLNERLTKKQEEGLLRTLVTSDGLIDFCSNDYLGFANHPSLKENLSINLGSGSTGSRLISGNSKLAEDTETMIASFHNAESALLFNTGYMANVGLFSCIATKDDCFISDEYVHASIIDGMRLNPAHRFKFRHNDLEDLESKLKLAKGRKFVAVESIYSMDGDAAPLPEIVELCKKYDSALIVDEAHATGIYGKHGEGLVSQFHLEEFVLARVHTYGKAMGLHGAAVLGSKALRMFLINHARSFIFATALPPHLYLQIQEAYRLLPDANRAILFNLINHFRAGIKGIEGIRFIDSSSPIQGIIIGDNYKTTALANHLRDKGFFIKAILSPTVPKGSERIRICIHSFNTKEQIDGFLNEV